MYIEALEFESAGGGLYDLYTFIRSELSCLVGSRGLVRSPVLFVMWWLLNKLFT
jgi:hypothetical protein